MTSKLKSFNGRELSILAQQPAEKFTKEGILMIREKQEGIFRKGEVFMERLFRLRGNLLFYFKSKNAKSEVIGMIILERFVVELDPDEEMPYSFLLVFDSDERTIHLAAKTEQLRDSWIEHLHIASYECLQLQLKSLRERLRSKTGKDPIENPDPTPMPTSSESESNRGEPFLEMGLSCDGLSSEMNSRPPDTFVTVHFLTPPSQQWVTYSRTEIIEKCENPDYLTTVGFSDPDTIMLNTKIRLSLYYVRERMTHTMTQIGQVLFTLADLLGSPGCRLRLRFNSHDCRDVGHVTILGWQNYQATQYDIESWNGHLQDGPSSSMPAAALSTRGPNEKRSEMLKNYYANIVSKTFRFPTNCGKDLSIHEYMAESNLTFMLPRQLLKLWVDEEKVRIEELQNLGELAPEWDNARKELMDFSMSTVTTYMQNARYLSGYKGAPFKPSTKKGHKEVEFAPTNLHLHRIWVQNNAKDCSACYDITTVGAFTAYAQKYKHGGVRRLLQQFTKQLSEDEDGRSKMDKVSEVLNSITLLKQAIDEFSEGVCRAALAGDSADLNNSMQALTDKTRQLIQVCDHPLLSSSVETLTHARVLGKAGSAVRAQSECSEDQLSSGSPRRSQGDLSPDKSWKWSGTDFVKSPTEEPWDLTRTNTEAAMLLVLSKVEEVLKNSTDVGKWLEEISPLLIKLKQCVEVLCSRAKSSLTFLTLQECGSNIALMHTLKYRRDVCFCQALTSAVSAFITKLRSSTVDETFLRQLFQIGVLMQFESLLSCHNEEMGMIEDMAVAVSDLSHVVFKIEEASTPNHSMPTVQGSSLLKEGAYPDCLRCGYVVSIPVPSHMFSLMPVEIQRGHVIKLVPVMFTVGINEQATLAETIGDTSVQHAVNAEFYQKLHAYYEKYSDVIGEPECHGKNALPMEQLMRHLHINAMSKKGKNCEVLFLAAEVCRKLNGIRLTSCKSAKDRTSMAVTLETVQLLQREHDLASHIYIHALDCLRCEGVRRENTVKNTGSRKYAFNCIQLLSVPKLYRPPTGVYGNLET